MVKSLFGQAQPRRIGHDLRALHNGTGLRQAALGEISSHAICTLETGRSDPTLSTIVSIVEALDALVAARQRNHRGMA